MVVRNTDNLEIYERPDGKSRVVTTVSSGTTLYAFGLSVVTDLDRWVRVHRSGEYIGWANMRYLAPDRSSPVISVTPKSVKPKKKKKKRRSKK
jgi:hypothetical protein